MTRGGRCADRHTKNRTGVEARQYREGSGARDSDHHTQKSHIGGENEGALREEGRERETMVIISKVSGACKRSSVDRESGTSESDHTTHRSWSHTAAGSSVG